MLEAKQTRTFPTEFTVQIDAENKVEFAGPDAKAQADAYVTSLTPVAPEAAPVEPEPAAEPAPSGLA